MVCHLARLFFPPLKLQFFQEVKDKSISFSTYYTGWCNNLNFPEYGKSVRAFTRLLAPAYDDGLMTPRSRSVTGAPLPSPRLVSVNIHNDVSAPHVRYSLMLMQWAQFVDHDLTHTPVNRGFSNSILLCRDCDSKITVHPECLPIPIPQGDPYFPQINITSGKEFCLAFTRSMPGQLTLGFREQMNQITSFADASNVYGSDVCEMRELRTFAGGRLNATRLRKGKDLLPQTAENAECKAGSGLCFEAGDARSSEQPVLAAIHTIFMREHNRLADRLAQLNPQWSDEKLYQEGRRIAVAIQVGLSRNFRDLDFFIGNFFRNFVLMVTVYTNFFEIKWLNNLL
jgi:peroxidase